MILGLDLSTTVCGIALIKNNNTISNLSYHKFPKEMSLIEKIDGLVPVLEKIITESEEVVTHIFLENYLESYSGGATSKKVIIMLAQINILGQYVLHQHFPYVKITTINVRHARRLIVGKLSGKNQKQQVRDWFIAKNLWKEFPINKNGKLIPEVGDMIDAAIMAFAGATMV